MSDLELIRTKINTELAKVEIQNALIATTFKGLDLVNIKKALFEGMARGFTFKDFLQKNVYAIPYSSGYSLMNSIDYARKVGMRSGVCGKSEPVFVDDEKGNPVTCAITIKRKVDGTIGEYTAKVYFSEYYNGHKKSDGTIKKNNYGDVKPTLWDTKPRTMIAKVAEMHALRMACPEDLAQTYVEEEMEKEIAVVSVDDDTQTKINECDTIEKLKAYYEENKGKGKAFAIAVKTKKEILEAQANKK